MTTPHKPFQPKFKPGDVCIVKKGRENRCADYYIRKGQQLVIKITQPHNGHYHYNIIGGKGHKLDWCNCFTAKDLELAK